jgi:hypothetical protein
MLLAAMNNLSTLMTNRHLGPASPDWGLYALAPTSSVLPVLALQGAAADTLRRVRGRIILWSIIAVLLSILLGLSATLLHQWNIQPSSEKKELEVICLRIASLSHVLYFTDVVAGAIVLCIGGFIINSLLPPRAKAHLSARTSKQLRWGSVLLALSLLWICYGMLINTMIQQRLRGMDLRDNSLSFGQVLALTTWFPVIVEFAYVWWQRPVVALRGRLIIPYEVVEVSTSDEGFELMRI